MSMSHEHQGERTRAYSRVVAKAWSDAGFKQRLLADPRTVLEAEGVSVPTGAEVRVVENTDKVMYFTLPTPPAELSDEQLDAVAGGYGPMDFGACRWN